MEGVPGNPQQHSQESQAAEQVDPAHGVIAKTYSPLRLVAGR